MAEHVANPPAGGPQEFSSTNDNNQNPVLSDKPWVVVATAHGQAGVVGRFADEGTARDAAHAYAEQRPSFMEIRVVKENDPDNGLPAVLADVEGREFGDPDEHAKVVSGSTPRSRRSRTADTDSTPSGDGS